MLPQTRETIGANDLSLEETTHCVIARFHGKQTVAGLEKVVIAMKEKFKFLRASRQPCLMLIDLSHIEKMNSECRKVVIRAMNKLDFDKLAIFGGPLLIGGIAKLLILIADKSDKVNYLPDEKQARAWLGI